jgi:hypothetical protein
MRVSDTGVEDEVTRNKGSIDALDCLPEADDLAKKRHLIR